MEFSKQEYWSGLPFPSPGVLPNPGIEPRSPALLADALPSEPPGKCWGSGVGARHTHVDHTTDGSFQLGGVILMNLGVHG